MKTIATGRNRTGPPCSVGRWTTRPAASAPTVHAPGGWPACPPAALQTTTDDGSQQNNTGPLGVYVFTVGKYKIKLSSRHWSL